MTQRKASGATGRPARRAKTASRKAVGAKVAKARTAKAKTAKAKTATVKTAKAGPRHAKAPSPKTAPAGPAMSEPVEMLHLDAPVEHVVETRVVEMPAPPAIMPGVSDHAEMHAPPGADDAELAVIQSDPELGNLFIAEAMDHLGTIEAALLELDDRPEDMALLNDIFRPFHTVKGNAAALGIVSVESVAHRVENLLDLARSGQLRIGSSEVDLVLKGVDVLTQMINDVGLRLAGRPRIATDAQAAALVEQVDRLIARQVGMPAQAVAAVPDDGLHFETPALSAAVPSAETAPASGTASTAPPGGTAPEPLIAPSRRRDDVPMLAATATAIKVDTRKFDNLVDVVGELIVVQSLIQQDPALSSLVDGRLSRNMAQLRRLTAELQRNSMALRMVPIRQAFQKVSRIVRDLGRRDGKLIDLIITGEDTELDRKMVEDITDPLMHMARNSVDHGIEAPAARERAGKPARATVSMKAYYQGSHVIIEVADDGAGLDTDRILASARAKGLVGPDETPAPEDIHRLIFEPGFSTAEKVTEVSGRGVGMDVVRRNIESLRGRVDIRTERGSGSTFLVRLPLTLAVLDGLLVRIGTERCVLPAAAVRESLRPKPEHVHFVQGQPRMVQVRESVIPLVSLGAVLGMGGAALDPSSATVVVVEEGGSRIGLVVEELLHKQEVVVKSLGDSFTSVRGVAGGAILGDGRIGLILDPHGIVAMVREGVRRVA